MSVQTELTFDAVSEAAPHPISVEEFQSELKSFDEFGQKTECLFSDFEGIDSLPVYVNEFWTAKQRQGSNLHEVSYRACYKPQLPAFFIQRLTSRGDIVYDPFMGRGTTLIEAAISGRVPLGCDINPLSRVLAEPRFEPIDLADIEERLGSINLEQAVVEEDDELLVFYHPETLREISSLREYLLEREQSGQLDLVDKWIRMVATNRLTGHSTGFFSVYSLPPNQAVTVKSQKRINEKRQQIPPRRDIRKIILKKAKQLLKIPPEEQAELATVAEQARLLTGSCDRTEAITRDSVSLVVTSPPFLSEVDYATDNWLRCWFNGIDAAEIPIWIIRKPEAWQIKMEGVFKELFRILKPGGYVAFEVGEVLKGKVALESYVVPAGIAAGLQPQFVLINAQEFTKTSNCWGVDNQSKGTNTNRIVLFQKPEAIS